MHRKVSDSSSSSISTTKILIGLIVVTIVIISVTLGLYFGLKNTAPTSTAPTDNTQVVPVPVLETPVLGRWVRVQRVIPVGGENYINISQIIAYDEYGNRIYVSAGSIINPYDQADITRTNSLWDNNPGTIVHTNNMPGVYVEIDLGKNYKISRVDIWNRRDCCHARILGTKLVIIDTSLNETARYTFTVNKSEYRIKVFQESPRTREL